MTDHSYDKERDPVMVAWAAGLYEGEGTAMAKPYRHRKRGHSAYVRIKMTDIEPLQMFHEVIGFGLFNGPYEGVNKPCWEWSSNGWEGMETVLELFRPFLSPRRIEQLEGALEKKPPKRKFALPCGMTKENSGAGYMRHRNNNTPCCEPCHEAMSNYNRERYKARKSA